MTTFGFAQEVVQDFESSPSVAGFEGLASATIVDDPSTAGNGKVFELVTSTGGNPWQGAEVILADNSVLDLTSDITITVDVWSEVAFSPMVKLESSEGSPNAANTQNHAGEGWETLTYKFDTGSDGTATADGVYTKVVFFPNRNAADDGWRSPIIDGTFYFDNVKGVKTSIGEEEPDPILAPTTASPATPEIPASDVISIYGSAFGTQVGLNNVPWDEGTEFSDEEHNGETILRIDFGVSFMGSSLGSVVDASDMTHFHIDYWVADDFEVGQVFNLKLSNHANNNGETNALEYNIAFSGESDVKQWKSVDVSLSDFTGNTADRANITEFLITAAGTIDNAYITNMYFYSDTPLSNNEFAQAEFKAYPNPTKDSWNIQTTENIKNVQVFNITGRLVKEVKVNASEAQISSNGLARGVYLAKISNEADQTKTIKLIKE